MPASSSNVGASLRQGQVEAYARHSDAGEGFGANQHDLRVGHRLVDADQLDPCLRDLAFRGDLAAAHAQALPSVGQA